MLDNTAELDRYMDKIEGDTSDYGFMLDELRSLGMDKASENGIMVEYTSDFEQIVEDYGYQDIDPIIIIGDL